MTGLPRFGVKLGGEDVTANELREVWRIADEAGFDHLWCLDLFVSKESGPDQSIFEGWALQAAMAAATKRIRIGCGFSGNTHRPPWLLAKLAVTVDHLSGGRLEFGIGAGYEEHEHRMFDIQGLEQRVGRLSESLQCLKLLWTSDRADFAGRYCTLRDAIANPKPIQKPYPPIWMGASGDQMLRLVARHADVWNSAGGTLRLSDQAAAAASAERVVQASRKLDDYCEAIGRDPAAIRRSVQLRWDGEDRGLLLASSALWLEAGFPEQIIYLSPPDAVRAATALAEMLPDLREVGSAAA